MNDNVLPTQAPFWDRAAGSKVFSHPLDHERFLREVGVDAAVLDYGCGRGRLCAELAQRGFRHLQGADYSREMILMASRDHPGLDFSVVDGETLPFVDAQFDAVLLFAVLTCVPSDAAQRRLIAEVRRVLRPGGLLLISDYPLQADARNLTRYEAYVQESGNDSTYGTFRLPDGGLVRHHQRDWLSSLLDGWAVVHDVEFDATTMNGNPARIVQLWARRTPG
jgi:SAM-dependent methyltransferase